MSRRRFSAALIVIWLVAPVHSWAGDDDTKVLSALEKAKKDILAMDDSQEEGAGWRADALRDVGRAQLKLGDREGALATLRQAVEATSTIKAETPNFGKPRTLGEIAETQREAGDTAAARETLKLALQETEKAQGETVKWNALMDVSRLQTDLGNLEAAREAARKALSLAKAAQGSTQAWHLGAIATSLAAAGDVPGAKELLKQATQVASAIPDANEKAQALNNIAYDQARMGEYDDAFRTAATIEEPQMQAHALIGIAEEATITDPEQRVWGGLRGKSLATDKRAIADRALREALPCARAIPGLTWRLQALSRIAYARAEIGDFVGALGVARTIPTFKPGEIQKGFSGEFIENKKALSYASVAKLQVAAKDRAGALRTLRQALPLAQAVANSNEKFYALDDVAAVFAEIGEKASADRVWGEGKELAMLMPEPAQSRNLSWMVHAKLKAKDLAGALRTAESISDRRVTEKIGALKSIGTEQQKRADREGARQTFQKAFACLDAFQKLKPADRPRQPAQKAAVDAPGIVGPDDEFDEATFRSMLAQETIFLSAEMGDAPAALKAARALPIDEDQKINYLANVAQMIAGSVSEPAGFDVAASLDSPKARRTAYSYVIHSILDRRKEEAKQAQGK
ncbi:MAG TPA: hypothetical protein VGZ22_09380 [Isosphaeraceae bacterium]|jgi:tetratricopeptide (TPR) repeat protein|nr:hypothetical protein [Isosphaeraceae bacterium]